MKTIENLKVDSNFAIIEKNEEVIIASGNTCELGSFEELERLKNETKNKIIFAVPFCMASVEKGYETNGDEKILAMEVVNEISMTREALMNILPDMEVDLGEISTNISDEDYGKMVEMAKEDVGNGEYNQIILSRSFFTDIDINIDNILSIYNKLLKNRGQYSTFLFNTDKNIFIGASPEKHLLIEDGQVHMNAIAGTVGKGNEDNFYDRLISFITNHKEINELSMVIDEELKMLTKITKSGTIEVPKLKETGAVLHTEADLNGFIGDYISLLFALRETLFAPTVVGGPIESAFKKLSEYERDSRAYYSGVIGIYDEDFLDTSILIRTAFIDKLNSILSVRAGAGIVKDSVPELEAQETRLKSNGFFGALTGTNSPNLKSYLSNLSDEEKSEVKKVLEERKSNLSKFYINSHLNENLELDEIKGKKFVAINNGDDFVYLSAYMIERMGGEVVVIDNDDFDESKISEDDIVILGPGYGDINNTQDEKMLKLLEIANNLMDRDIKLLGICLGHQAICKTLGYDIVKQDEITQGEQLEVNIGGMKEKLGFYNSFSPVLNDKEDDKIELFADDRVLSYKDKNISSIQAHPESILSINGFDILKNMIFDVI